MSTPESENLKKELDHLEEVMHEVEQFHTLEEQVEDMKRRGIDPHESYQKWDDDEEEDDWDEKDEADKKD